MYHSDDDMNRYGTSQVLLFRSGGMLNLVEEIHARLKVQIQTRAMMSLN